MECSVCNGSGNIKLESRITKGVFTNCICGNCLGHGVIDGN